MKKVWKRRLMVSYCNPAETMITTIMRTTTMITTGTFMLLQLAQNPEHLEFFLENATIIGALTRVLTEVGVEYCELQVRHIQTKSNSAQLQFKFNATNRKEKRALS